MTQYLTSPQGRRLAYNLTAAASGNDLPGVVFLGGFKSDMTGSKALHLEQWAKTQGRAFLRFDYSGHGQSDGAFEDGCIGEWAEDARAVIAALTTGPQILVGSSMGGWISLLIARDMRAEHVHGLVGIAAAPDFTNRIWDNELSASQHAQIQVDGRIELPSEYEGQPYVFTRKLFDDGRQQSVLDRPLDLPFPVRLLQGSKDASVPVSVPLAILDHATCPDLRATIVKDADHRFSTPECLDLIVRQIEDLSAL